MRKALALAVETLSFLVGLTFRQLIEGGYLISCLRQAGHLFACFQPSDTSVELPKEHRIQAYRVDLKRIECPLPVVRSLRRIINDSGGQPMKGHQVFANQHNASTHSEGLLDWFRDLHPTVQIALIFSMTTILIMLIFNPVAGGVLVSF